MAELLPGQFVDGSTVVPVSAQNLNEIDAAIVDLDTRTSSLENNSVRLLIYNIGTSSYPARPSDLLAGQVTYKGPVAPSTAIIPDTWEDTTGIWP